MRIARKEAKESQYWLRLIEAPSGILEKERQQLAQEAKELMMILGAILKKIS